MKPIGKLINFLTQVSGYLAALNIVMITAMVFLQVFLNAIDRLASLVTGEAIGLSIPSYSEFTGFFLAASSFLGLAFTFRGNAHIRVTLFIEKATTKVKKASLYFCFSLAILAIAFFGYHAALLVTESYIYEDKSSGMISVSLWIPQLSMPLGLAVFLMALTYDFIQIIKKDFTKE